MDEIKPYFTFTPLQRRWLALVLAILGVGYLFQACTPLRIYTDTYKLLSMALSAYEGHGYLVYGEREQFPLGYPITVRILLDTGIASSSTLVLANILFMVGGLFAFYKTCRYAGLGGAGLAAAVLTLGSWVLIKHIAIPLSEPLYFFLSYLTLFFAWRFYREPGRGKWLSLFVAWALAFLSYQTRTIGLVLFPVLIAAILIHPSHTGLMGQLARGWKKLVAVPLLTVGLVALLLAMLSGTQWFETQFVSPGSYFQSMLSILEHDGIAAFMVMNIGNRVLEMGELVMNLPSDKVGMLTPLFYFLGALSWVVLFMTARKLIRDNRLLVLVLYFTLYSAVLAIWPFNDSRFWIPVLPVMALLAWTAVCRLQAARLAGKLFLGFYLVLAGVALVFTTRLSLSGRDFSEQFGDGSLKMSYRQAHRNGLPVDSQQVEPAIVRLIERFDPLARAPEQ